MVVEETNEKKVGLKREIDLIGAIFVIIGCQIGSGIFISPKSKFQNSCKKVQLSLRCGPECRVASYVSYYLDGGRDYCDSRRFV